MGCMEPIEDEQNSVCPFCGYDDSSLNPPSYLQPKTVLDSRYIVGRLLSFNGESALYIGYDNTESAKVFIREYMPDAICQRMAGTAELVVNQSSLVQYKNYLSEFVELNKSLMRFRTMSHIIAPSDMFYANNTAYSVMPYCDGITLKQYLADNAGELSWEQVKKLFPPLLTTLGCLHNAGIVHRGISLENILVTDKVELKLTGFSISEIRTVNTDLAPELYPGYSAPEQYAAADWDGTWTDVYAVAAVMYRLLTGCMPTEAMARVSNESLLEPCKINPHVPANISKVIMQAMQLSCQQRIQTITDFVTKLFEQPSYMNKLPMGATQTIPINVTDKDRRNSSAGKKKKKKKSNIGMFIGAVILVVIVVAAFFALIMMLFPDDTNNDNNSTITDATDNYLPVVTTVDTSATEPTAPLISVEQPPVTEATKPQGTMFVMPDLKGKKFTSVEESETWKDRLEFEAVYEYSDEYERGIIFDQDIPGGTDLYPVQKVKLFVSQGLSVVDIPDFMKIDDLTGFWVRMTKEEYVAVLNELNIKYKFRDLSTPTEQSGLVMDVYCKESGQGVGGQINVKEGNTLYVDISVFSPDLEAAG